MSSQTETVSYWSEPKTDGHAKLAEAFGVFDGKEFVLWGGPKPEIPVSGVVYITGESGSGKTTILRKFFGDDTILTPSDDMLVADLPSNYASLFGLSDAALFFTEYRYLSDSQKFRMRVAHTLSRGVTTLVVDEFLSTLDRDTAKISAYNLQSAIRRVGGLLVACSAHEDLTDSLGPNVLIRGESFPSRWTVSEHETRPIAPAVLVRRGDAREYGRSHLAQLHYRGAHVGGIKDVLFAEVSGRPVGVLVGTHRMHDGGRRISRLVVHPTYRGVGVGKHLVQTYLEENPTADVVAAMADYNPVFERAGMVRVGYSVTSPKKGTITRLKTLGFDTTAWASRSYCESFVQSTPNVATIISPEASGYVAPGGKRLSGEDLLAYLSGNDEVCARVLWRMRPREYPKFEGRDID